MNYEALKTPNEVIIRLTTSLQRSGMWIALLRMIESAFDNRASTLQAEQIIIEDSIFDIFKGDDKQRHNSLRDDVVGMYSEICLLLTLPGPIHFCRRPPDGGGPGIYWEIIAGERDKVTKIDLDPGISARGTHCPPTAEKCALILRSVDSKTVEHVLMRVYQTPTIVGIYGSTEGLDLNNPAYKEAAQGWSSPKPEKVIHWSELTPWRYQQRQDTTLGLEGALEIWILDRLQYNLNRKPRCLDHRDIDFLASCIEGIDRTSSLKFWSQLYAAVRHPPWLPPPPPPPPESLEQLKRRVQNRENVR